MAYVYCSPYRYIRLHLCLLRYVRIYYSFEIMCSPCGTDDPQLDGGRHRSISLRAAQSLESADIYQLTPRALPLALCRVRSSTSERSTRFREPLRTRRDLWGLRER